MPNKNTLHVPFLLGLVQLALKNNDEKRFFYRIRYLTRVNVFHC